MSPAVTFSFRQRLFPFTLCLAASLAGFAAPALAQNAASSQADDDERAVGRDLAEPDYSVVNLPTTLRLPKHASVFHLTHRFNENIRRDDFNTIASNAFGIDEGASIGLEYRFGVMRRVEAVVQRTNLGKTIQFSSKIDALHQSASMPVSMSGIVSVEGDDNFKERRAPALGAVISRTLAGRAAVYATPVWVHNSAAGTGTDRDTMFLGLAGRVRVSRTVYLTAEASPRVGGYVVGTAEYGFGIEKLTGAHVFDLVVSNSQATTYRLISHGGNAESLYIGFNLTRKF